MTRVTYHPLDVPPPREPEFTIFKSRIPYPISRISYPLFSSPDLAHRPFRTHEAGTVNEVSFLFVPDGIDDRLPDLLIPAAGTHHFPEISFMEREEARP